MNTDKNDNIDNNQNDSTDCPDNDSSRVSNIPENIRNLYHPQTPFTNDELELIQEVCCGDSFEDNNMFYTAQMVNYRLSYLALNKGQGYTRTDDELVRFCLNDLHANPWYPILSAKALHVLYSLLAPYVHELLPAEQELTEDEKILLVHCPKIVQSPIYPGIGMGVVQFAYEYVRGSDELLVDFLEKRLAETARHIKEKCILGEEENGDNGKRG